MRAWRGDSEPRQRQRWPDNCTNDEKQSKKQRGIPANTELNYVRQFANELATRLQVAALWMEPDACAEQCPRHEDDRASEHASHRCDLHRPRGKGSEEQRHAEQRDRKKPPASSEQAIGQTREEGRGHGDKHLTAKVSRPPQAGRLERRVRPEGQKGAP